MSDFLFALAGGFAGAGDKYQEIQDQQRNFNMEQKAADADMLRKQNFARFGKDLDMEYKEKGGAIELDFYKKKGDFDEGKKGSGYVDPKTKIELSKEELKGRKEGLEGLVAKEDFAADQGLDRDLKRSKKITEAKLSVIEKRYGKNSEQYKAAEADFLGVPRKTGEMTDAEARRVTSAFGKNVVKIKKENPGGESMLGILDLFESAPGHEQQVLIKEDVVRDALNISNVADKIMDFRSQGMTEEQAKQKANLSGKDWQELLEYLEARGDLERHGGGLWKVLPGEYKGSW